MIGNRTSTLAGGDISGGSLRSASYTANNLNQYSSRTVPNGFDVLGLANVSATVEVNGSTPDYRRGEFFHELLTVTNSSASVWDSVSIGVTNGSSGSNVTGSVFIPPATESYGYDLDGNLTNDGRWAYTWDGENRLINMTNLSGVSSGAAVGLTFQYDWQGRRIQKLVSPPGGSTYSAYTNNFLYDGWNLLAIVNPTNGLLNSFVWGNDLSGTPQGAGGVGGLLVSKQAGGNPLLAAFDGNGNLMSLVDATAGTNYCSYDYGPFGEPIRLTPNSGNPCPFQFSTKFTDVESGLSYYGYRYYSSSTGDWLSRDPDRENSDFRLYGFVHNNPIGFSDFKGLRPIPFVFDAFINNRLGSWIYEPFSIINQFETDERGFGAFDSTLGNARVYSYGSIESTLIGSAGEGAGVTASSDTGISHRRHNMNWNPFSTPDWEYSEKKASIENASPVIANHSLANRYCSTTITFNPSAGYPFTPGLLTPNIDYKIVFTFVVSDRDTVTVYLNGSHNRFPDYEAYADGSNFYKWQSPSSGPGLINLNRSIDIPPRQDLVIHGIDIPKGCLCGQ